MGLIGDLVRPLLRRQGLELVRIPNLGGFLEHRKADLVVDVGANLGQFAKGLRKLGYRGRIVSCEPIPDCAAALRRLATKDPLWDVRELALGEAPGSATLNVSDETSYSSFLALSEAGERYDSRSAITRTIEVEVSTVDDLLGGLASDRPFLKIDTQGFEPQVLAGAARTLDRCVGLLLELPVDRLYETSWTFAQAVAHLERLGFVPAQMMETSRRWTFNDPVSATEFDVVFRRDGDGS
jgi:FkbM family methyltransferase